jgi:EAL domain-containing protein (putative c-di-GMP-specific phosphodiesterase class I)
MLVEVAERLAGCVRVTDSLARSATPETAISRLGGGEFTLLLTEIVDAEDAARVAGRVIDVLSRPFTVEGHELFATANVGIAVFPNDGKDAETLVRNADAAMYQVKTREANRFQFYDKSMNAAATKRLHLESHLHRALDRNEFTLHYQPLRDAKTGALVGAEALLRWSTEETGNVTPDHFIPIAERTGLIIPIGEWVLRTACEQARRWQDAGFRPIRIGVNLSGYQLAQPALAEAVARTLRETGLSAGHLELEITESTIMRNDEVTTGALNSLRDMGVGIALDDFGTGYSALSYLRRFPIDRLKIDRSFVREIATNADDAALTSAVIALAHSLRLHVIAEGVETVEQADFLREHGCDELQGFLFSRAVPASDFVRFLDKQKDD